MSIPAAHIKFQYAELDKLTEQLGMMRGWGISESDPGFLALLEARGIAEAKVGLMQPMSVFQIARSFGMSPGVIALFAVAERGWMVEARAKPGALPVYHYVSDEIAEAILKEELTPEQKEYLFTPDPYIGE